MQNKTITTGEITEKLLHGNMYQKRRHEYKRKNEEMTDGKMKGKRRRRKKERKKERMKERKKE